MSWAPFAAMAASQALDKFGPKDRPEKLLTMNKGQQGLLAQLIKMFNPSGQLGQGNQKAMSYQQQLMDPSSEAVNQFAQPYMNEFNQRTIPGLAEQFAGLGGGMGGGLSSSGFGQALGAAGGNLQTQLAALKAGLGQQAGQSLMNQYSGLLGGALSAQPFAYQQQGPSAFGGVLSGWAKGGFQMPGGGGGGGGGYSQMPQQSFPAYGGGTTFTG